MEADASDDSGVTGEAPLEGDPLDHLWNAAHEMLRALRGLLEAADEFVETQRARPPHAANEPRPGRVHHIDIDVRSDVEADDPARNTTSDDRTDDRRDA
jgi:hypothetical protein